jgi:hypothetical protein
VEPSKKVFFFEKKKQKTFVFQVGAADKSATSHAAQHPWLAATISHTGMPWQNLEPCG